MLEIEIVDANLIEGGIEVFARAWQDGVQIGFGKDGTVDIERFRVLNPPVLVQDPNGDITVTQTYREELQIPPETTIYREDPEEALLQVLEDNIRAMQFIHADENIIPGKRGNTTTTVYANPSVYMFNNNSGTWADLRAETTSLGYDDASATEATLIGERLAPNYNVARNRYTFDLSSISATDNASSATFSVKSTGTGNGSEGTYPANGALVAITSTPSNDTSDFAKFGTTRYADTDVSRTGFASVSAYNDWNMNATGLAAVEAAFGGSLHLGIRMSNDFSDSTVPTARSFATGYWAASSGTTNDPKLVVEHYAGAASTFIPKVIMY